MPKTISDTAVMGSQTGLGRFAAAGVVGRTSRAACRPSSFGLRLGTALSCWLRSPPGQRPVRGNHK